ncbi:hypothetical protein [Alienimonas chondri]|uniref:Lycopene cyclase domain-containing protein n=1 Tax=Alienimonas chondri TaxID=2681879 RepID=A0ABX1VE50_9PLAN|nr:hypothetical protein [Alienimonas chondri]NNJ25790.1 hypothetical protein [Alienimonas chondri]
MNDDSWQWVWLLMTVPLGAVAVGALALCWRNRRVRPLGSKLFAAGVVLLMGANGVDLLLYTIFPIHEWLDPALLDLQVAYVLTGVVRQAFSVVAALLITAAVFVPDDRPNAGALE